MSTDQSLRIPVTYGGLQVNFCKNPACPNFGIPASQLPQPRGRGALTSAGRDTYTVVGLDAATPGIKCLKCNEIPPLKSNKGIYEEYQRLNKYLNVIEAVSTCPVAGCENSTIRVDENPTAYRKFGTTKSGSPKFQCKICKKVFTHSVPYNKRYTFKLQTEHGHKNINIFKFLVNKVPLTRIAEMEELSFKSLQQHLKFIHKQCVLFMSNRERRLFDMSLGERYLCVDRQDYHVNWSRASDRRHTTLHGIGCADLETGYVLATHVDFDSSLDVDDVEAKALEVADHLQPYPFREFARLWLSADYEKSVKQKEKGKSKSVLDSVNDTYEEALNREDIEASDEPTTERKLPKHGLQVHSEYTLYGHFLFVKKLLNKASRLIFFMDQESGIRAACHSVFCEEIKQKTCDAFYVRINKELTIDQKRVLQAQSKKLLQKYVHDNPFLEELCLDDIRFFYLKTVLHDTQSIGKWRDKWLLYPFPTMSEPEKAVCWLTDLQDRAYSQDDLARLYGKATLHPVDRFFMQVRRRVNAMERSIFTASRSGRVWHAYAPYDPSMIGKLLDIFRVYYNFVQKGHKGTTPAMRLGLAKAPVRIHDILYYDPLSKKAAESI